MSQAAEYLRSRGIADPVVLEMAQPRYSEGRVWLPWIDEHGREIYATGRATNGADPKYKNAHGERPPLFASPGAWEVPEVVLVEGQLDALAAAQAGRPAFATTTAALSDAAVPILADKRRVILVRDADAGGVRWREEVIDKIGHLVELHEVRLPHGVKDLAEVAERAHEASEDEREAVFDVLDTATPVARTTWAPIDLGPLLEGEQLDEPPSKLHRSDGAPLIYRAKIHSLAGEPESGKGWLALAACVQELERGGRVLYCDFEDSPATIVARLQSLGASREAILENFLYVRPDEPVDGDRARRDLLLAIEKPPALVVIDGLTEALVLHGFDVNDNSDNARFLDLLARPFARAGAAVLEIDHLAKDRETRGRYAIGAQHKLAGVDVAYTVDVIRPFGRGLEGLIRLTLRKDRAGFLGQCAVGPRRVLAEVALRANREGTAVEVEIRPPAPAAGESGFRPTILMERASRALEGHPGLSLRALREAVGGKASAVDLAIELLKSEGYVEAVREGRATAHRSRNPYRQDDDEEASPS